MNGLTILLTRPVTFATIIVCVWLYYRQYRNSRFTERYVYNYYRVREGEFYRLFTAGFLHGSYWHILMNLYSLYNIGSFMEGMLGPVRFAILLFGGVLAGNLACYFLRVRSALGLSGGLYAVMFFYFMLLISVGRVSLAGLIRNNIMLIVINFMPGIAWQAHLGGAVCGVVLSFLF